MPSPIDTIMAAINPVPRRRSGAHSQASFAQPNRPQRTRAIAAAGKNCRPPKSGRNGRLPVLIHQVSSAPMRHQLAVGEVRQPGGPEDQRQPDRGQRDDQAEPEALGGELGGLAPLALDLAGALAQREEHRLVLVDEDRHLQRLLALVGEVDALGQGLGVDGHRVGARPGHVDGPAAGLVARRLAREPLGPLDGDLDALVGDPLALLGLEQEPEDGLAVGLGRAGTHAEHDDEGGDKRRQEEGDSRAHQGTSGSGAGRSAHRSPGA